MTRLHACLLAAAFAPAVFLTSCATEAEKKPVGPSTGTSRIPWNQPVPGQGQGQFGMLPQNQYRR
ncbi:MAG: hypothetical protein ACO3JG_01195 [Luteolibacter sp.]